MMDSHQIPYAQAGPSGYAQGYSQGALSIHSLPSNRGGRPTHLDMTPNSVPFNGNPPGTPPFYPTEVRPSPHRHDYSNPMSNANKGGHNNIRPSQRGFGRGRGRGFSDRHQPPANIFHQPSPYMSPSAYHYAPTHHIQNFSSYPQHIAPMPFPYGTPNLPYPPPLQVQEQILKTPSYLQENEQSNEQSFAPLNAPPISPATSLSPPHASETIADTEHRDDTLQPESSSEAPLFNSLEELTESSKGSPITDSLKEPSLRQEWVIAPFRPDDPADAFGIIISPNARPPPHIVNSASECQFGSPPPKAKTANSERKNGTSKIGPRDVRREEQQPEIREFVTADPVTDPISCSTTENGSAGSATTDAFTPGSPVSSITSGSVAPRKDDVARDDISNEISIADTVVDEQGIRSSSPSNTLAEEVVSTVPAVKKSWASLLQASGTNGNQLPTSKVIGFSVPASADKPSIPPTTIMHGTDLSRFLASNTMTENLNAARLAHIRPRGLVNTGNMCFANAVLQVLVYCPPFYRFFTELGKCIEAGKSKHVKSTPLVDATIEFLKEFDPGERDNFMDGYGAADEFEEINSFIPLGIYDAMKEQKRFENMGGGQQEDAEEFFGFFIDTLEEELLSLSDKDQAKKPAAIVDSDAAGSGGWVEVVKRNKHVVARSSKSVNSPISRIFGGKFKSILKVPGQRDSVVMEDWNTVRLDIQREQVNSIEDALRNLSHPQHVHVSSITKGGATVDGTQQILIDSSPPILVLHLKRFHYDTSANGVVKLGKQISFGPNLEIPSEALASGHRGAQAAKYKLFAVVYHHGQSASGGHYTLDVLHPNRGGDSKIREGWVRIDDELVSDLREQDVFGTRVDGRCAYLLFYRRLHATPRAGHYM